ncbi:MAG: alpha-galactoside ABC transporter substrate-binding protein [Hyphomicrobiales bacterium]|nr:alpha-galactoside ABC transporter substrate-binding protein [Hyphomicrobiales bacterium]
MTRITRRLGLALLSGISGVALSTSGVLADPMPPEKSLSALEYELLGRDDLWTYKSLDAYNEAPFLTELVEAGKLPPVGERLPAEPLVHLTDAMSDGVGEYGGVFRHVIGGRPEGWNWLAGQHQGWGGINMAVQECFTRVGPLWQVKAEDQSGPLPNLAKSWDWNDDRTELTMHLVEGIRWSDGDPFDTEDVAFWWDDNVQDDNVASRMSKNGMGEGTTMEVLDDSSFKFTFKEPQGPSRIQSLAYIQGCPGPAHILKPQHPKHNADATYDSYRTAQTADMVPPVVLGPFVPVVHRPDEIVIMRRNPYYWKVDEAGNQLPYMNEMHFKLTSWSDRTTQAVAGTGDFSNMENPGNYVEALKQSQAEDAPTKAQFGPRVLAWEIELNYSDTVGVEDEVDKELRGLFRDKDFRVALNHAIDRDAVGQSIARGPFSYPYPGGFSVGSPYYDVESTVYYPFDKAKAMEMLDALGITDTDGNGTRNLPGTGADIEIDLTYDNGEPTDKKQVDAVVSMLGDVGIRILPRAVDDLDALADSGNFNMIERRHHWLVPTRETCEYIPLSLGCPDWHPADADGNRDLFDFEVEMVDAVDLIQQTWDPAEAAAAASKIQKLWTENAYTIGLTQAPAALLINKRINNAHPGTPVFMFEWAEDGVVRERLWAASDDQLDELLEGQVPEYE